MNARTRLALSVATPLLVAGLIAAWVLVRGERGDHPPAETARRAAEQSPPRSPGGDYAATSRADAGSGSAERSSVSTAPFSESRSATRGVVRLRIVDGARKPRAGASALLRTAGEAAPRRAEADADGRVEFRAVPFGRLQFVVAAPHVGCSIGDVDVRVGRPVVELELILVDVPSFVARVVDAEGFGVAGAIVRAPYGDDPTRLRTDADGAFRAPAWWRDVVCVEATGYVAHFGRVAADDRIVLHRGRRSLRGVVLAGDRPAAHAVVKLRSFAPADVAGASEDVVVRADESGAFVAETRFPGGPVQARADYPGFAPDGVDTGGLVTLPADAFEDVPAIRLVLRAATKRRVRVLEANGDPVPAAEVSGSHSIGGVSALFAAKTDDAGWCDIAEPDAATSVLFHVQIAGRTVEVFPDPPCRDGVIELRMAPCSFLEGRATDAATGAPLAGAAISFWDGWMETAGGLADEDGRWRLDRPQRDAIVVVRADGYRPVVREASATGPPGGVRCDTAHELGVVVELGPHPDYCGGGLRNDSAQNFLAIPFRDRPSVEGGAPEASYVRVDASGYAAFSSLPPGRLRLVYVAMDGRERVLADRVFAPGEVVKF
jgi:hypothetical protein